MTGQTRERLRERIPPPDPKALKYSGFLFRLFRARAGARENAELVPPRKMWCSSVVLRAAMCECEVAKTGRRSISRDGNDRSRQDLAIRNLGSRVNPAFVQNTT